MCRGRACIALTQTAGQLTFWRFMSRQAILAFCTRLGMPWLALPMLSAYPLSNLHAGAPCLLLLCNAEL